MVKISPEKKKENTNQKSPLAKQMKKKKAVKPATPKKESSKEKQSPDDIVEFYGRSVSVAEKEKMVSIMSNFKKWASTRDIKKFVEEFPAFITEGNLVLRRTWCWKCVTCKKYGHPREVCPKSWIDGEWVKLCYVCGEPGFPHPLCMKKDVCYLCMKEGHRSRECPDRELHKKPLAYDDKPGEEKENNEDQTDATPKKVNKKAKKNEKRPLEEKSKATPVASPKKKMKNKPKA